MDLLINIRPDWWPMDLHKNQKLIIKKFRVAKFSSIRMIFAIAACVDLKRFEMNLKTAFLNGG